jgi:hypothetical protein
MLQAKKEKAQNLVYYCLFNVIFLSTYRIELCVHSVPKILCKVMYSSLSSLFTFAFLNFLL